VSFPDPLTIWKNIRERICTRQELSWLYSSNPLLTQSFQPYILLSASTFWITVSR
jgi:hypothetical protein